MLQVYLLTIGYLLIGSGLLLVDEYGGQYILLIRLRRTVRSNLIVSVLLIVLGLLLSVAKFSYPIPPGPVLIGDLLPLVGCIMLTVYHTTQLVVYKRQGRFSTEEEHSDEDEVDMLKKTGSLIETHKRNLGFVLIGIAVLHFLFPGAVLL
ncbi:MAG TPA: hypothetical protein VKZ39_01845 [Sphaerochaetaceae bacterium]|jgi:L-lactate permease|nr:hypothetical protein [Sphaerochaetaceae bacterium]